MHARTKVPIRTAIHGLYLHVHAKSYENFTGPLEQKINRQFNFETGVRLRVDLRHPVGKGVEFIGRCITTALLTGVYYE